MFSQTVEYALRAVVYLAGKSPSPAICEEIAAATKVPRPYMAKVLLGLVRSKVYGTSRLWETQRSMARLIWPRRLDSRH